MAKDVPITFLREKNNIDLWIGQGDKSWLVEHKLKDSIKPSQANRYAEKFPGSTCILITLFAPYGTLTGWTITSYKQLSERLQKFPLSNNRQDAAISEYKLIVEKLSQLAEMVGTTGKYDYAGDNETLRLLKEIKFDVPYIKYRTSKLAYLLYEAASKELQRTVEYCENEPLQIGGISIDWDYQRTGPIIDLVYQLAEGVRVLVQIQAQTIGYGIEAANFKDWAAALIENGVLFDQNYKTTRGLRYYTFGNFAKQPNKFDASDMTEAELLETAIEMFREILRHKDRLSNIVKS